MAVSIPFQQLTTKYLTKTKLPTLRIHKELIAILKLHFLSNAMFS